jgi:hypothetical protein
MRKLMAAFIAMAINCPGVFAQLQTADGEGVTQAATLKKLTKKAKYGAYSIQSQIAFSTGKGIDGTPVVTAAEDGTVDMVAMEDKAVMGFMLPYNQFVKITDYDFFVYYKNGFKSQKYPPEKVSLTDEDIFLDDSYGQFYGFKADETGQRCRFKYNYEYTDAKYLTRVFFHEGMPVKEKSISFKVPSWLQLDITEKNFDNYKIRKEVKKDKDFTTYTYTGSNLPAIHQEASSLSRPYYLPHLIITVRSFTVGGKAYNGFKTLDDMYAWYNLLYKKADNKVDVLKNQVALLTQGKTSDEEKIKSIYYWVQDNIRYIAFEEGYAGFVPQTVQEVYKNKFGDCKGMANLMTEMLKAAGYDAHFSWIGTKDIPYDRTEIQSMCVDNHAISTLYFKGKTYFLDGTEKYAPFGKNAYRIQGKKVLVQNGNSYKVESVPAATVEDNQISTKALLALDGDKIKGHVKLTFDGETRNLFHYIYNNIPANRRKDFINQLVELNNNNTEATNIKTSDFKNRDIPLVLEGDIEITNQVTQADKLRYTGIDFFPGTITGFIPKDDRENPIDINRVFTTNDEVVLELPASAKAVSLPKSFDAAFNNNSLKASYSATANKIILTKTMKLNTPVIYNADFAAWKNFINQVKEFNRSNVTIQLQ